MSRGTVRSSRSATTSPADRTAKIEALQAEITDAVGALVEDPAWRAMLETAARFYRYSLANQLAIAVQAGERGFCATRVAGFQAWKRFGRSVCKGQKGLAVLAPCSYKPKGDDHDQAGGDAATEGDTARIVRGFRVVYVFDVSQTEGHELPDVLPELLTGDAPAKLWDGLTEQIEAAGFTIKRGPCWGGANGMADALTRTVTVRSDVEDAQAVKTLAHELAHILCEHTADNYDYQGCRGRAEAEAESVAYIVTAWAGMDTAAYTVPYVARWSGGDAAVVHAAAKTVTAAARAVIDALDPDTNAPAQPTLAVVAS